LAVNASEVGAIGISVPQIGMQKIIKMLKKNNNHLSTIDMCDKIIIVHTDGMAIELCKRFGMPCHEQCKGNTKVKGKKETYDQLELD
jgi:hypothetical protein